MSVRHLNVVHIRFATMGETTELQDAEILANLSFAPTEASRFSGGTRKKKAGGTVPQLLCLEVADADDAFL